MSEMTQEGAARGQRDLARKCFIRALAIDPKNDTALKMLASLGQ